MAQLAPVELGNQHLVEALEVLAEVVRERVEVSQVDPGHLVAGPALALDGGVDGAQVEPQPSMQISASSSPMISVSG